MIRKQILDNKRTTVRQIGKHFYAGANPVFHPEPPHKKVVPGVPFIKLTVNEIKYLMEKGHEIQASL